MLHTNDAILRLYLNNQRYDHPEKNSYDNTQENTRHSYQQLEQQLQTCQTQLETKLTKPIAQQMIVILAIYADETLLTSGLYSNGYLWPKLQKTYIGNKDGGNVFFQAITDLLALPDNETPTIVDEMYHYCLINGFKGRHYNNHQALNYYTKQLATRINNKNKATQPPHIKMRAAYDVA